MLANISLYWFTGAIGSSFWPYYARMHGPWPVPFPVTVPTGYAEFPKEILRPPRSLAERTYTNIRRWTEMPKGGHFAALEQPAALANDVAAFFRRLTPSAPRRTGCGSHRTICGKMMHSARPTACRQMNGTAALKIIAIVICGGATLFR